MDCIRNAIHPITYLESTIFADRRLVSMKSIITKDDIPIAVKCDVWYGQIKAAMPDHKKLHIVADNLLSYVSNNKHLADRIHEVVTSNTMVSFHVKFKGYVWGNEILSLLRIVEPSWIEAKDGFISMYVDGDDLRHPYLDDDV